MIDVVRIRVVQALVALVLALGLGACGSDSGEDAGNPESVAGDYEKALAGAPKPLAGLYDQANEILPGGLAAYQSRIEELQGHPLVVNKWASWCGPCRAEFPFFQSQASKNGERVGFLGIDGQDSDDAAATFLEELPLPYPSYSDPDLEISSALDVEREFPATIFYDSDGEVAYVHRGGYQDEADLAADIERHAQ